MKKLLILLLTLLIPQTLFAQKIGVTSSADPRATEAGMEMLRKGGSAVDAEMAMILRIMRISGRPLSISVGQSHTFNQDWRKILATITDATAEGLEMRAQVAPWLDFGSANTGTSVSRSARDTPKMASQQAAELL